MQALHDSPFFADISNDTLPYYNENESIYDEYGYNYRSQHNNFSFDDDFQYMVSDRDAINSCESLDNMQNCQGKPTKEDEEWLLETIQNLCKSSRKLESKFEEIKSQLEERGFIHTKDTEYKEYDDIVADYNDNYDNYNIEYNGFNYNSRNEGSVVVHKRSHSVIPRSHRTGSPFSQVFTSLGEIGEGGYGKVFKIRNLIDKNQYALKVVDILPSEASNAMKEVQCLAALNSTRTLRYYSSWIRENEQENTLSLFIQTEFINGQNLAEFLHNRKEVDYSISLKITKELAKALVDIHSAGIVHRDFNPSNVILTQNGSIKVIDFGISSIKNRDKMNNNNPNSTNNNFMNHSMNCENDIEKKSNATSSSVPPNLKPLVSSLPPIPPSKKSIPPRPPSMIPSSLSQIRDIDRFCINAAETKARSLAEGTPLYSSPRQLNGVKSTEKDDIYSFGIMIFEIFSLFKTQMQKVKEIRALRNEGKLPSEFENKYPIIADLIMKMTQPHGKKRPSAFEILHSNLFEKL
ncbi:hypothetical protein TRFO_02730 [Tritrichomonas foetus]|uniref:Protein kinase domain-containing protein n=1 Tax=Tritrichomonas foetus TaxID=1144522 RepID=A0A1J4KYX9_9EUKA|nr:hypothetical protein TRFO_02730 [Tritrichomonas foetus]|eukprot:OHT16459.1 hypothetical protein TRFO_02730 [Tritrichomonas foetus]